MSASAWEKIRQALAARERKQAELLHWLETELHESDNKFRQELQVIAAEDES